jgi:mono/diheme cytochrome c family protein
MTRMRAIAAFALAASAAAVTSAAAQPMVLGRQVPSRADAPAVVAAANPRSLYVLHCAGCHGVDGAGSTSALVPDMRQLGGFLRVPGGREFIIKVPGVMGSGLNDQQVAGVTNWVLGTLAPASIPPGHAPFDAAEVAHARAAPLVDVAAVRGRLIEQARAMGIALQ